jgi:hypothetical protein
MPVFFHFRYKLIMLLPIVLSKNALFYFFI